VVSQQNVQVPPRVRKLKSCKLYGQKKERDKGECKHRDLASLLSSSREGL